MINIVIIISMTDEGKSRILRRGILVYQIQNVRLAAATLVDSVNDLVVAMIATTLTEQMV